MRGQVDFKDVNFHYRSRPAVKVLKNLNLHVNAGDSVAICGPSGSGKSTCAALIFRFYDPVSGCVVSCIIIVGLVCLTFPKY